MQIIINFTKDELLPKITFLVKYPIIIDISVAIMELAEIKHLDIKFEISEYIDDSLILLIFIFSFFPQKIIYKLKLIKNRADNTLATMIPQISHIEIMYIKTDKKIALAIRDI